LASKGVKSVAIVAAAGDFPQANAVAMAKAAQESSLRVTGQETLAQGTPAQGTTDFVPVLEKLKAGAPDQVVTILGSVHGWLLKAYEASGWKAPLTGRIEFPTALTAVSPQFLASGGLSGMTGVVNYTPLLNA